MNKSVSGVILVSVIAISSLLGGCISGQSSPAETPPKTDINDVPPPDTTPAAGDSAGWVDLVAEPGAVDIPITGAVVVAIATDDEGEELRVEVGTDPSFGPNVPNMEVSVSELERTGQNEYRFTWPAALEYATTYYCRARLTTKQGEIDWVTTSFTTEAKPLPGQ